MENKHCVMCPQNGEANKNCITFYSYRRLHAWIWGIVGCVVAIGIIAIESGRLKTIIAVIADGDTITRTSAAIAAIVLIGAIAMMTAKMMSVERTSAIEYGIATFTGPAGLMAAMKLIVTAAF